MKYASKIAEATTDSEINNRNQQNPPDAEYSSPWRGAAIGGTFGGLLATAMGYLYGHRGKWLAYDAIAGGLTGGAGGYAIDSHNQSLAKETNKKSLAPAPNSVEGMKLKAMQEDEAWRREHGDRHDEWNRIQQGGGFGTDIGTAGLLGAFKNWRKKNVLSSLGAHLENPDDAKSRYNLTRIARSVSSAVSPGLTATTMTLGYLPVPWVED